jgi:ABC-2 type transport system permease protein
LGAFSYFSAWPSSIRPWDTTSSNSSRGGPRSLAIFPNSSRLLQILGELRAGFIKDVRVYLRYPSWIASEFITLPAWFLLFAIGVASWAPKGGVTATLASGGVFRFFYWGFIFLIIFSTSIWGIGQFIRNEQLQGTIEQLFLAPVSRVSIISGRFARTMLTDLAIIVYTTVLLTSLSHETVTVQNPLLLLGIYGLLEFAVLGFGLAFAAITFRLKSFNLLSNLTQFTVIGLCGLFFPLSILPLPILAVSMAIPFTYFADLFRFAGYGGATLFDPSLEIGLAAVLAVAMFLGGLALFKNSEKRAKERGQIGTH